MTPRWARWADVQPWTVGIEEEAMLLEPAGWALASRIDDVLPALSSSLIGHVAAETHGSVVELASAPHATVGEAVAELASLRHQLGLDLERIGLRAGAAGTHPFAVWNDVEISPGARYQSIHDSMRELARREPTLALHVHVAVPDPEQAVIALNGLRVHLPVLLGLSANSPFWQGRDTGLASARIPIFGAFPRVGLPRRFASYAEYVEAVDVLVRCQAIPEPTFLWWDARLQPRFGTIEVRIMDTQTDVADTAALAALVQCLVRIESLEGLASRDLAMRPELLDENRFLAARDGVDARLLDGHGHRPLRDWLGEIVEACAPHAAVLGCSDELAGVERLAADPGAARQRRHGAQGLRAVVRALSDAFAEALVH